MLNLRKEENITIMRKNNVLKITAIALLSAFALTACDDDIIAKPKGYDDNSPVVNLPNGTEVYNNDFTDIYDSIRSGNLASDVLDELLYQYSVSVFGNYNKVTAAKITNNKFGDITLKQAVKGLSLGTDGKWTGNDDANNFIKAHKAFWTKNKAGHRVDDAFNEADDDAAPSASEYARLNRKWKTIEKRIAEKMYASISGGSYSERNVFEEERFMRSLDLSIENNVRSLDQAELFKGVLTSAVEDYDVFNEKSKDINGNEDYILHRENYQSNWELDKEEKADQDATYVEDNLIPDIYRQLLVEQYILDESYDTLGRTSARHISVLSISKNSNYSKGAINLMNTFVNDVIFDKDRNYDISLDDFKVVSNAWIGTFMDDANYNAASTDGKKTAWDLMNAAVPEYLKDSTDSTSGKYFQGTAFGDMMEEMEKINDNPVLSENESTYTGSDAYTIEVGKEIKKRELDLKDHTSTGWYVKSVGADSLPDSLKNQLFDINVANALNPSKDENGNQKDNFCVEYSFNETSGAWETNELDDEGKIKTNLINVVGKVKGQYFLRNTTRIKGNPVENDLLFENDGTYYVVLVEDAIRSKNLDKKNYVNASVEELDQLETYINEIVQLVANNDTYKNLSKKHWVEDMDLKYHDQVVYDYFKSNFPELFED